MRICAAVVITVALGASAGCTISASFHCETDTQCGGGGTCQPTVGFCSFADSGCESGQRFDDYAGAGLGGTCVGGGGAPDAPIDQPDSPVAAIDAPVADASPPDAMPLVIRLHEGGGDVVGVDYPGTWTGDPSHTYCPTAMLNTTGNAINGTVDDALFQTQVYNISDLNCTVPVPPATYQIRLLFAEVYYDCVIPGDHKFDVDVEGDHLGTLGSRNDGGGCATDPSGHPFEIQTTAVIGDGAINLRISGQGGNSGIVAAIEVIELP